MVNHGLILVNQAFFHGRFILCADEVNDYVTNIDLHFVSVHVLNRNHWPEYGGQNEHECPRPHGHGHGVSPVTTELLIIFQVEKTSKDKNEARIYELDKTDFVH